MESEKNNQDNVKYFNNDNTIDDYSSEKRTNILISGYFVSFKTLYVYLNRGTLFNSLELKVQ